MTAGRVLTAAVAVMGISLGFASPACGDAFGGTYSLTLVGARGGGNTSWTAQSTCPSPGACVAHITSSSGWSGDAQQVAGRWTMTVDRPNGQSCPDGTRHSESQTWSWDVGTLKGEVSGVSTDPIACPQGPADAFSLTKIRSGAVSSA
jgi:hypothetical protein